MSLDSQLLLSISSVTATLQAAAIDYTVLNAAALLIQGVATDLLSLDLSVQWDLLEHAHALFPAPSPIVHHANLAVFHFLQHDLTVNIYCYFNTVVMTDPDRVSCVYQGLQFWVKSLDFYVRTLPASDPWVSAIQTYWRTLQQHNSRLNAVAWNQDAYDAWVHRFGSPHSFAARIQQDPQARLVPLYAHFGSLTAKKVINLLGSHGAKAVALALLGARVTVVDISQENARYARELAAAAGVPLRYLVMDVLSLPPSELDASYDLILLEMGVLHYFVDLAPLALLFSQLLRSGGRLVLQDFHPVSTKLITSTGKRHKVTGNYFDKTIVTTNVAFSKHLPSTQQQTNHVYQRRWTLGEIVTAVAQHGLHILLLEEEPNMKIDDIGLPKTFTLIAEKL